MKTTGLFVLIAAIGMMCTLMSSEIRELMSWDEVFRPSFLGTLLAHMGTVIGAYVAGRITPEDRSGKSTRRFDEAKSTISKVIRKVKKDNSGPTDNE